MSFRIMLLAGLCAATANADIVRWDNGDLVHGTEGLEPGPDSRFDHLQLDFADFRDANLRDASFQSSNLDGEFNGSDLIESLAACTYEADAGWASGDFDGNGRFDTSDLIHALADGGYEVGSRAGVSAIPEPVSILTITIGRRRVGL